jgi:hypothetical protein
MFGGAGIQQDAESLLHAGGSARNASLGKGLANSPD